MVIVVFPLNALMRDQLQKLERSMNVCILQSNVDEEKVAISKDVDKRSLVFGHPEVYVENKDVCRMLKKNTFHKREQAIVVDEAHLVQQWYVLFD